MIRKQDMLLIPSLINSDYSPSLRSISTLDSSPLTAPATRKESLKKVTGTQNRVSTSLLEPMTLRVALLRLYEVLTASVVSIPKRHCEPVVK